MAGDFTVHADLIWLDLRLSAFRRGCVKTRSGMVGPGVMFSRWSNCNNSF
jgi:hypothetical protein